MQFERSPETPEQYQKKSQKAEKVVKQLTELDEVNVETLAKITAGLHQRRQRQVEKLTPTKDLKMKVQDIDAGIEEVTQLSEDDLNDPLVEDLKTETLELLYRQREISLQRPPTYAQRLRERTVNMGSRVINYPLTTAGKILVGFNLSTIVLQGIAAETNLHAGHPERAMVSAGLMLFNIGLGAINMRLHRKKPSN